MPALQLINLSDRLPRESRIRQCDPNEVRAVVLHQTAFSGWAEDNPMWANVRDHFLVRRYLLRVVCQHVAPAGL